MTVRSLCQLVSARVSSRQLASARFTCFPPAGTITLDYGKQLYINSDGWACTANADASGTENTAADRRTFTVVDTKP